MQEIDKILFGVVGGLVVGTLLEPIKFWLTTKLKIRQIRTVLYQSFCINYWRLKNIHQIEMTAESATVFVDVMKALDFDSYRYFREKESNYYYQIKEAYYFNSFYESIQNALKLCESKDVQDNATSAYLNYIFDLLDVELSPWAHIRNILEEFESALKNDLIDSKLFQQSLKAFTRRREMHRFHFLEFENFVDVLAAFRSMQPSGIERAVGFISSVGGRWLGIWLFKKVQHWYKDGLEQSSKERLKQSVKEVAQQSWNEARQLWKEQHLSDWYVDPDWDLDPDILPVRRKESFLGDETELAKRGRRQWEDFVDRGKAFNHVEIAIDPMSLAESRESSKDISPN